ncbi:hypothetical protein G9A89_017509 [Geosiphon pyriformis]|nr:hypothetical protein G9A89_017509 [Geosiphon pyriformis]
MDPISSFAGVSGSVLAELEIWSNIKKKAHVESIYSYGPSYKKPKNSRVIGGIVASSAGTKVSWSSEVESKNASVNSVFDIENMNNMVAEKTSYVNFNNSKADKMIDNITLRRT